MVVIDLTKILEKHQKGWLALSPDNKKLIATGSSLKEVLEKAAKTGVTNPSVLKTIPRNKLFIGQ